jgi:uncharacterized protein YbaP (TraB family)
LHYQIYLTMKNFFLFALLCVFSVSGYSQSKTLLWRVAGKDLKKPSYLYGTFHLSDARAQQFADSVMPAFNTCSTVLVENVDADSIDKADMFKYILLKDKTVKDFVSKVDYEFLRKKIPDVLGKAGTMFNAIKPMYTIMMAEVQNARNETQFTVDGYFKNQARQAGKTLLGIETMQEAQKSLDEISVAEQCKMMVDFFKNYSSDEKSMDTLIDLYQQQDLPGMNNYYTAHDKVSTAFNKSLVVARNKKFIDKLITLMKTQTVFCAVGTLHLPGETGLINQLQKKGYKVTPVFSNYTPHTLQLTDNRDWGYYEENDLLFSMRLPTDPTYQVDTTTQSRATTYYEEDTVLNMGYILVGARIEDSASLANPQFVYQRTINAFNKTENWKQITQRDIVYKNINCKEVEYNIAKGSNVLYRVCKRDGYLYCFGVTGTKDLIYSNRATYFFDNIEFMFPSLYFELTVKDELSKQKLKTFNVQVTSSSFDTTFAQDTAGLISLNLPTTQNDKYILSISSKNYVTKKIELNTTNIIKTNKNEIYVEGEAALIKKQPNVDYSVFNTPVARAAMMPDNTFNWDTTYIKTQKEIIAKKFKPAAPAK